MNRYIMEEFHSNPALLRRRPWLAITLVAASAVVHATTAIWVAGLVGLGGPADRRARRRRSQGPTPRPPHPRALVTGCPQPSIASSTARM